jgi:hypothetical protein
MNEAQARKVKFKKSSELLLKFPQSKDPFAKNEQLSQSETFSVKEKPKKKFPSS